MYDFKPVPQEVGGVEAPPPQASRRIRRTATFVLSLQALLFLIAFHLLQPHAFEDWFSRGRDALRPGRKCQLSPSKRVTFSSIDPSKHIEWHPCEHDDLQCARLEVPLDWKNSSDKRTMAIAILRIPAKVPVTDSRYGGPIIVNPGGPGGSGVNLALGRGRMLQDIVDATSDPTKYPISSSAATNSSRKDLYFDIIGFDPRGVNNTTPHISCFPDLGTHQNFRIQSLGQGMVVDEASFRAVYNRIAAVSGTCSNVLSHDGERSTETGRFVSTASVVEDIMEITEKLAEWREKEAKALLKKASLTRSGKADVIERTRWIKKKEPVQYMGFSYGTVLGSTLATMHPKRMKRVMIDGVCDIDDYYEGGWLTNLQDTDKIMTRFYEQCHEAGPHECSIYSATGAGGSRAIVEQALSSLRHSPIPVVGSESVAPDFITYTDLVNEIILAVYKPKQLFKSLSQKIFEISVGNGTSLAKTKQAPRTPWCPTSECRKDGPWSSACRDGSGPDSSSREISASIYCSDAPDLTGTDSKFHYEKLKTLQSQSWVLGSSWSEITMYCANWYFRPAWRFEGDGKQKIGAKTAHPILLASNTYDPVTPLRNAKKFSKRFPGSGLLEQEDDGHCTISDASLCTAKHVREYFQTGKVPKKGTVCKPDHGHFGDDDQSVQCDGTNGNDCLSEEDQKLLKAVRAFSASSKDHSFMLGI